MAFEKASLAPIRVRSFPFLKTNPLQTALVQTPLAARLAYLGEQLIKCLIVSIAFVIRSLSTPETYTGTVFPLL